MKVIILRVSAKKITKGIYVISVLRATLWQDIPTLASSVSMI